MNKHTFFNLTPSSLRKMVERLVRDVFGIVLLLLNSIILLLLKEIRREDNSILIIRTDNLGDFILWYAQAKALRVRYPQPQYKLNLVCNRSCLDLANASEIFDEIVPLDLKYFTRSPIYRYRLAKKIRGLHCSMLINPIFSRDFYRQDSLARFSGARKLIAYDCDLTNTTSFLKRISDSWYTQLIPKNTSSVSEIDKNVDFMVGLGIQPQYALSDLSSLASLGAVSLQNLLLPEKYFIIFPGASWSGRKWPAEYFARLANLIQDKFDIEGLICGSLDDDVIARNINGFLSRPLINLSGRTSLLGLIAVVQRASLVVANESGGAHLAPALKVPTVCIMGGGHFGRFAPYPRRLTAATLIPVYETMNCYGCNWSCIHKLDEFGSAPCIAQISVNSVFEAAVCGLKPLPETLIL